MFPKWHILLGIIFSILLYILFKITLFQTLLVFLSSVLIDIDHYLFFVKRKKEFSLKKAFNWHKKLVGKQHKPIMHVFHTIEFVTLILILSFFWDIFVFVLIGILFHSIIDIIDMFYNKWYGLREFSLIRYLLKDKKNYF